MGGAGARCGGLEVCLEPQRSWIMPSCWSPWGIPGTSSHRLVQKNQCGMKPTRVDGEELLPSDSLLVGSSGGCGQSCGKKCWARSQSPGWELTFRRTPRGVLLR